MSCTSCSKSEPCGECGGHDHNTDPLESMKAMLHKELLETAEKQDLVTKCLSQAATVRQLQSMVDGQPRSKSFEEMEMDDLRKKLGRHRAKLQRDYCDLCPECDECKVPDYSADMPNVDLIRADRGQQF